MKIMHLFDFFSPLGGGMVDFVYKLTKVQAQRGHEVVIYTSDYKLNQEYIASLPGVKVHTFKCISSLAGFFIMPGIIKGLRNNLKSFDVMHVHTARSFQDIVAHHYAKKYRVPYLLDTHGTLPRSVQGEKGVKWLLKWLFDVVIGNKILKDADKVVAETQVGINEYLEFGVPQERIVLIQPPLDTEAFAGLPQRGAFRNKYNLNDKKIVMFLGRIHWIKGIDFLVESFAELTRVRNDSVLVIVGNDDGFKTTLEDLINRLGISDKVIFTGFLGGENKLEALVDADMVIQTSRYEQGAWAPFEAVLCGTPIIVSSNSGAGEDVKKIDAGYLVEYGNTIDLKDKMQYILGNQEEAHIKTEKAKIYIETNLSVKEGVKKYEELYKSVLGKE
jgi:glycosyltransferase involved in cell wall biosynthesis